MTLSHSYSKTEMEFKSLYDACKHYYTTRVVDTKADHHVPHEERKYITAEGTITFQTHVNHPTRLVIYVVEVVKHRQGIFTHFLQQVAADPNWTAIVVVCVGSVALDDLLTKITLVGQKFVPHACDFYWTRSVEVPVKT